MNRIKLLFMLVVLLFPLTGCTAQEEEALQQFPAFSGVADDGETYDNARMSGGAYIVVFQQSGATVLATRPCMRFGLRKPNFPYS